MYYLKYRPQNVSQLDNEKIRESLGKALLSNNFTHAYLLIGPKGTGKTSTARIIAKIVNCPDRKKGEEPCNKCDSCKTITAGSALDVIEIDGASNTGVDDIRNLREKAKLAPTTFKYKVYIIDEVHMLSNSAFNALLKILEEPPEHVIFVLATTDDQKLPATVVSRCLVYNFGQTSKNDVIKKLQKIKGEEKIKISEEVLIQIVETVGTSHRDAQKLLEQVAMQSASGEIKDLILLFGQAPNEKAREILQILAEKKAKEALELLGEYVKNEVKIKDLISAIISILRDILLFRNGVTDFNYGIKISDTEINWLIEHLLEANNLLRDSPIPQLPLEMVIMDYCKLGHAELDSAPLAYASSVHQAEIPKQVRDDMPGKEIIDWPKILAAVKPYNHSLVAFLRASRPMELSGDNLTLEVFYKFHKEKLEEKKNREILEKVVSDIIGKPIGVKFLLAEKIKS